MEKSKAALIVPCYNEADRLDGNSFISFVSARKDIKLVFVNDGSKDNTAEVLSKLASRLPEKIFFVDLKKNGGKAEAVRQGVLYASENLDCDFIGFLDADLSTDLFEMESMFHFIRENDFYEGVVGSRISRMGAEVKRKWSRKIFSSVVGAMIYSVTRVEINDTQCGAKIFSKNFIDKAFKDPFHTDWLFDVEVFVRLKKELGKSTLQKKIYEYPLMKWVNADGSKVGMKEIYRTPVMIAKIGWKYNVVDKWASAS